MKKVIFLSAITIASSTAFAGWDNVYGGAKIGWSHFQGGCEAHNTKCIDDTLGGGIFAGYQINNWLAIEGGYDYLGKPKANYPALENSVVNAPYEARVHGMELGLKTNFVINDRNLVYAKLGGFNWWADKKGQELTFDVREKDNDLSGMLGIGYQYALSEHTSMRVEYQWMNDVGGDDTGGSNVHFLTLGFDFGVKRNTFQSEIVPAPQPIIIEKPEVAAPVQKPVTITLGDDQALTMFAVDSARLTHSSVSQLQPVSELLLKHPNAKAIISGHTDSSGSSTYNQALSEKRAYAVAHLLIKAGVDSKRLQVFGFGESQPIANNNSPEGKRKNRRVEIYIPAFQGVTQ